MISIRRTDIPLYFQASEFYRSLDEHDNNEISIPVEQMKTNKEINSADELRHLLET